MFLEIITPEKKIFSGEVKLVKAPGAKGSFEILTRHAPIISILEKGQIKIIDTSGQTTFVEVGGGVLESKDDKIVVLAEPVA
ncbi:ATP synthase F1 subunit epsilon [Mangrovibacterium diazotrophicum]|uniref:ATP synthase F1 subcomplex epsilon subunit n=1 Tax=Mangrovibacterium diazotrophicum TaxID=1261403 RepID=A0A419W8T4_9BACT|nr:ATP synthase F1 subunit epsilon [Mangrovibacterium diazotrophicum]RKD91883.1 ATP synthase F1 subcomplex epsilon subunit [Mangrovibacterium diazotrophicum]